MPFLVDGSNLAGRRGGDRDAVRRRVLELARHRTVTVRLLFDGPPPDGRPSRESRGPVTVSYSGGRSADDVIVGSIPRGSAARNWTVVTDDRELRRRVKSEGAGAMCVADFERKLASARPSGPDKPGDDAPVDVEEWERYFSAGRE